jgi:transcriptional regulator with XRE-family HTH domain
MKMSKSELSKRVKELRSRKGLSQEQLAENSGLSFAPFSESKTAKPNRGAKH